MTEAMVIGGLASAIAVVLALRTRHVLRVERGRPRGVEPGHGHTRVEAGYWSGGAGGGHGGHFDVPKDPQEYARRFVPRTPREPGDHR